MKKLTFILGVVLIAGMTISSCSKEKDCKCKTSVEGVVEGILPSVTDVTKHIDDGDCSDLNKEVKVGIYKGKFTCKEE